MTFSSIVLGELVNDGEQFIATVVSLPDLTAAMYYDWRAMVGVLLTALALLRTVPIPLKRILIYIREPSTCSYGLYCRRRSVDAPVNSGPPEDGRLAVCGIRNATRVSDQRPPSRPWLPGFGRPTSRCQWLGRSTQIGRDGSTNSDNFH